MFKNQTATSKFIYLENCIYLEILVKFTKSLLKFTKFTSKFSYIEKNEQINKLAYLLMVNQIDKFLFDKYNTYYGHKNEKLITNNF